MKEIGNIGKDGDNQKEQAKPNKTFKPEIREKTTSGNKPNDHKLVLDLAALRDEKGIMKTMIGRRHREEARIRGNREASVYMLSSASGGDSSRREQEAIQLATSTLIADTRMYGSR